MTGFTMPGAYRVIDRLRELKTRTPGETKYGQKYIYADYYEIFDEDFKAFREKNYAK